MLLVSIRSRRSWWWGKVVLRGSHDVVFLILEIVVSWFVLESWLVIRGFVAGWLVVAKGDIVVIVRALLALNRVVVTSDYGNLESIRVQVGWNSLIQNAR